MGESENGGCYFRVRDLTKWTACREATVMLMQQLPRLVDSYWCIGSGLPRSGPIARGMFQMAYDDGLAHRIRESLGDRPRIEEKEMFGGIAFMLDGNMCCGVIDDKLMARVGPDAYESALEEPYARPMDFTGRSMRGFVYVEPAGISEEDALVAWIDRCIEFAESLPAK